MERLQERVGNRGLVAVGLEERADDRAQVLAHAVRQNRRRLHEVGVLRHGYCSSQRKPHWPRTLALFCWTTRPWPAPSWANHSTGETKGLVASTESSKSSVPTRAAVCCVRRCATPAAAPSSRLMPAPTSVVRSVSKKEITMLLFAPGVMKNERTRTVFPEAAGFLSCHWLRLPTDAASRLPRAKHCPACKACSHFSVAVTVDALPTKFLMAGPSRPGAHDFEEQVAGRRAGGDGPPLVADELEVLLPDHRGAAAGRAAEDALGRRHGVVGQQVDRVHGQVDERPLEPVGVV